MASYPLPSAAVWTKDWSYVRKKIPTSQDVFLQNFHLLSSIARLIYCNVDQADDKSSASAASVSHHSSYPAPTLLHTNTKHKITH